MLVQSSHSLAKDKMFGFHVKLLLVTVITSFTVDAVQFNCVYEFHTGGELGKVYGCKPTVTLSGSTTLENVTGVHLLGLTNDDVEYLHIDSQNLTFVPQEIVHFFKNLKVISYKNTNMLSISAKDLKPFPQLEMFILHGSKVTSIDGDLFTFTPLLKFMLLGDNPIQHIGQDLVTNLNHLERLYLFGNICIDEYASTRAAVVKLASKLSVLCPPLDVTTTAATTTSATTTTLN